ncbi:MAG: ABC transporter permease [Acidisphaera sp.]|nr:ABC transporter permease [Acidisphaera sp.]MBV9811337.1 ABC transporter permease [Acetobacteraceae bacterium]
MDTLRSLLGFVYDADLLSRYGWRLIEGLRITAIVVTSSCVIGFVLAYPICLARMARSWPLSVAALGYITVFRGTPLLCQLYLVYYGAGEIRPFLQSVGLWMFFRDAFFCCIFVFALNTAAYQAEIFRGALAAVSKGQREAAAALGLSRYRTNRHVVWPQAFLVALRPLGNELISMVKSSALAAIVTLLDLMGQTRFIFARTFDFSIYLYAAVIYLAITETIRRLWRRIERAASPHMALVTPATMPEPVRAGRTLGRPVIAD